MAQQVKSLETEYERPTWRDFRVFQFTVCAATDRLRRRVRPETSVAKVALQRWPEIKVTLRQALRLNTAWSRAALSGR